jgi:hypothetical protein
LTTGENLDRGAALTDVKGNSPDASDGDERQQLSTARAGEAGFSKSSSITTTKADEAPPRGTGGSLSGDALVVLVQ